MLRSNKSVIVLCSMLSAGLLFFGNASPVQAEEFPRPLFLPSGAQSFLSTNHRALIFEWTGGRPPFYIELLSTGNESLVSERLQVSKETIECTYAADSTSSKTVILNKAMIEIPKLQSQSIRILVSDSLGSVFIREMTVFVESKSISTNQALGKLIDSHTLDSTSQFQYRQYLGDLKILNYFQKRLARRVLCNALHG